MKCLHRHRLRPIHLRCGKRHLLGRLCEQHKLTYKKMKPNVRIQKLEILLYGKIVKSDTTNLWMATLTMMQYMLKYSNVVDFHIFNRGLMQEVRKVSLQFQNIQLLLEQTTRECLYKPAKVVIMLYHGHYLHKLTISYI
uniref:Uncharacterized protein n=1 Tax=Lactuca sativa TaxID=4236 RepID=A0A9R1XIF6_LACSA|nr:hypothetical protein LSAT_V11C300141520 [Lactuca sativa]